ncbi:MAG: hypothetical protein LBC94_05465 [Desulfovibrio sp.]|jgi:hypothetical protein|nr:hypothetical protein [Desulfovibrio sp.]
MADIATRISIQADDRASAVMRTVARESETMCKRIEDLGKNATKYFMAFQAGFSGVSGLGSLLQETATTAMRYETLGLAMNQAGANAGRNRAEMAAFETQLVKSGIAMNESREILTQLAAANIIDLSKSAQLARTAQDLAVVGGVNSSEKR